MSMEDRMNDAQFTVRGKLCHVCKNWDKKEHDPAEPLATRVFCKKLGDIPKDILRGETYHCMGFELDRERFLRLSCFLPEDVVERLKQLL